MIVALLLLGGVPPAQAADAPLELAAGCGEPAPVQVPSSVTVGGRSRALITVVPQGYRPDEPHALVIAFHGRTSSNATVRRYYDLERHARTATIFVYPAGVRGPASATAGRSPARAARPCATTRCSTRCWR